VLLRPKKQGLSLKSGKEIQMLDPTSAWSHELDRRIALYEDLEAAGKLPGRLTALDYWALTLLSVALVAGFWLWGR